MVKAMKYSVVVVAVLGMIALGVAASSAVAMAQDTSAQDASSQGVGPGRPPENPGSRNKTDADFDRWMRQNPESRQQIMKDPSLLNNPDYLAKHPELQKFMNDHPDFQKAVKKNPERMMRKSAHAERRAAEHRREHNARPVKQ